MFYESAILEYALSDLICAYTQTSNNSCFFQVNEKRPIRLYNTVPEFAYSITVEAIYRLDYRDFFSSPLEEAQETQFAFPDQ
jgi:hypothetical protein